VTKKSGFTLVELLVVISIIGLLVTMIMPTLSRARDLGKRAVCAAQVSSYGRGINIFVAEHG